MGGAGSSRAQPAQPGVAAAGEISITRRYDDDTEGIAHSAVSHQYLDIMSFGSDPAPAAVPALLTEQSEHDEESRILRDKKMYI